ncbi:MAG: response regulator [Gemmatimonadetes bacterium]|nr:response regulator [Gemmatimonadota bacterium]
MSSTSRETRSSTTLRGQLGLLYAALAVPLLLLQLWWSYHDYRGARERAWDDALAFADAVELAVGQFVDQSGQLLRASAARSGTEWLDSGSCTDDMRALQQVLPFENVLLVTTEGRIVCSAANVSVDASATDWPWFAEWSGAYTIAPAVEADFTGSWIIPLVAPILDSSEGVSGALVGTLPLLELSELLEIRPGERRLTTITDTDGIVIARSTEAERWIGNPLPPSSGSDRTIAPGRSVAEGPDLTGVARTWGQVETDQGWVVYVGVPDAVVFGPAVLEAVWHVGGTLLVVLLAVLLGAWFYTRIAGSLKELATRTRAIEAGEVIPVPSDTPEEVAEVIEHLNDALEGRSRAESGERAARDRFASLFDNAVFGISVSTTDGRFLQVNRALVKMLGYESEEALLSAGPTALFQDSAAREAILRDIVSDDNSTIAPRDVQLQRADGSPIIVRVGGHIRSGPHDDAVFEAIVQDVTEERRRDEQFRQNQKMEAIGQLAGGVAHDFNNLLTVIAGNVELLEDDLDHDDPLRQDLGQIAKATQRARSLTRRLLTFSRPSREGVSVVDLNEVIPELSKMLVPLLGETVRLRHELTDESSTVPIDPGEMEQIVVNLVLNARDAIGNDGEILITSNPSTRSLESGVRQGVEVCVRDDGVGMDLPTQQRIFEPFFTTKPMGEGSGLGLSSVYGIVQRVGGSIEVDSEAGRGTEVRVWFPVLEPARAESAPAVPTTTDGGERVLVAEDDELVRTFVGRALESGGFAVHLTSGGEEALAYVRSSSESVDLVLSDVVMPGMGGRELATALAKEAPLVPVLFMSGYVDGELLDKELEDRPEALIRKPFTVEELHSRVRRTLDGVGDVAAAG